MSADQNNSDTSMRWKTRYYDALGELENKEKGWREIERLLRHLVSRLTLAADMRHPPLTQSLTELRNAIRDGKEINRLRQLIETISVQIGELDQVRTQRQSLKSPARILQTVLKNVSIPAELSRHYKELDKQLDKMEELAEVNAILEQVSTLLNRSILGNKLQVTAQPATPAAPVEEEPSIPIKNERHGRFLLRLFGKDRDATEPEVTSTPTAKKTTPAPSTTSASIDPAENEAETDASLEATALNFDSPKTIAPAVGELLLQMALRLPDSVKRRINFRTLKSHINKARKRKDLLPIVDVLSQHIEAATQAVLPKPVAIDDRSINTIADTVKSFLTHFNPPQDLLGKMVEAEKLFIENPDKVSGIVHCLNSLADMVAEICSRLATQRSELEGFFTQLSMRLQELDSDLQKTDKLYATASEQVVVMEQEVHGEISQIRNVVAGLQEMLQFKQDIQVRLDSIDNRVKQFRQSEQQRYQEAQATISQLTQRVHELEEQGVQLRRRMEQTQQEAMQDVLTGLPNRKAYEERVAAEVARCRRYQVAMTMVVWDVDKFKSINDTYGHAAGDRVLKVIGEVLADNIRTTDFIARYGGEEFVMLLPETELSEAHKVADKLRALVEGTPFHFQEQRVVVTVSAGLAQFRPDESVNTLFERADQTLYQAKQNGRNRVEIAA